jgi:hypothetical protein
MSHHAGEVGGCAAVGAGGSHGRELGAPGREGGQHHGLTIVGAILAEEGGVVRVGREAGRKGLRGQSTNSCRWRQSGRESGTGNRRRG